MHIIKRNSRELRTRIATVERVRRHALDNHFGGEDVSLEWFRSNIVREIAIYKPHIVADNSTYWRIRYHSNEWLEITSRPPE